MKLVVLFLTAAALLSHASGPIAVYALVDKVTFEPDDAKPERIKISGVFITAAERTNTYSAPQRGYLYLALPRFNTEIAKREWADLKSVAGSRQVVGFGSSWAVKARVRKPDEQPGSPDEYAMGNGLVKVNPDHPSAKALLEYKDR